MISDDNHPRMQSAAKGLLLDLKRHCGPQPLSGRLIEKMNNIIVSHRRRARARGVEFPALAAFVIPRLGVIELVRADADEKAVQIHILNLAVKHPTITLEETVQAVTWAFPNYRPENVVKD